MKWVLSSLVFCLAASASAATHTHTIRVLSYNIHGLPDVITKTDSNRFADIGRILAERRKNGTAPDVVAIQESFTGRTMDIAKISGYPYVARGPNATDLTESGKTQRTVYSSGLMILSEFPISDVRKVAYDLKYCDIADCGANKGALMVALDIPDLPRPLKVFDTHSQSDARFDANRAEQFEIFARFIKKNVDTDPFLVAGDFNAKPDDGAFLLWRSLTSLETAGEFCVKNTSLCQIDPHTDPASTYTNAIDHIFFSQVPFAGGISIEPLSMVRNFGEPVDGRPLSDHLGYEAEFEVSWSD